ncbi:MAG: sugar ABC transporter ATP-binding protein [Eubacteriales bacterium]|nr:sugar ABC transporter ATP-binding protein [Eubacteriales bacterium]
MSGELAVEMRHITKKFSGVKALEDVSFSVRKGEIHALIGENGAGKSTLMNVLSGKFSYHSYEGQVFVEGQEVKLSTPKDANQHGVVMVHQELALIPELSVAENMFLGNMPLKNGAVQWKAMYDKAGEILKRLSLSMDVKMKVKYLSIGQQQLVEISKAIMLGGKVMVLDEPTAPLTGREIEFLFNILRELKQQGITVIYISHRLEEIFQLTDRVSVMRDGKMIVTRNTEDIKEDELVSFMIGRKMKDFYPRVTTETGKVVLDIKNYSVGHPQYPGKNIVDHVDMSFRSGEIVGISGLLGAGRTELMMAVTGGYKMKGKGTVLLNGKEIYMRSPRHAIKAGIGFVTEDRKGNGLVLGQTICFNTSLASLNHVMKNRILSKKKEESVVDDLIRRLKIKAGNMYYPVSSLSGGNQQKVVFAKWLATSPKVLILDEPTRGVDVGAKYEIYTIMKQLAKEGVAVVMISSDLPEIIGMSDRVYVMCEGKLAGELQKQELSEDNIMKYATGTVGRQGGC